MAKVDFKKTWKDLYGPSGREPILVEVPAFNFLMVDGAGDPNTANAYHEAVEALFAVAYAAKFRAKKAPGGLDFTVMPLEGLWWGEDMATFSVERKDDWLWRMMIMQPPGVTAELIRSVAEETSRKKDLPALSRLRFEAFAEGRCAQILHTGPFSEEGPTLERLHRFIGPAERFRGRHHEIYLSDVRRGDPSKWRTILRQPLVG
ncbi:MAG: GyrI-like domain-containing protein [Acidobacteria bacterium]|nr:GyrI-like domain-containing protein [Acidobacteriota bacterium]MBI3486616.1 GyrI-like domain-containing protein [Acidobacteriota bacterium]